MDIKTATINDVDGILNIIYLSIDSNWNKNNIIDYIRQNKIYLLLEKQQVLTFILFNYLINEAEIYLIATHPNYRKKYFAQKLLDFFLLKCRQSNIKYIFLEVRKSNFKALNFYLKNYFNKVYIRKDYYNNPVEDAVIMKRELIF